MNLSINSEDSYKMYDYIFNNFTTNSDNTVIKIQLNKENIQSTFVKLGVDSQKIYNKTVDYFVLDNLKESDKSRILDLLSNIIIWTNKTLECAYGQKSEIERHVINNLNTNNIKNSVLEKLEKTRGLLLEGPPNHDNYFIIPKKANEWVLAQKTNKRRNLAQKVLKNIRYISHRELLEGIKKCVEEVKINLIEDAPTTFLIPRDTKKSNFYITLLFLHFWQEKGYKIDYIISGFNSDYLYGNVIDVDDMAYSGNQTQTILSTIFRKICNNILDVAVSCLGKDYDDLKKSWKYLPRIFIEKFLKMKRVNYLLTRIFMSEYSFENYTNPRYLSFPIKLVTSEIISYMKEVNNEDRDKLKKLFKLNNMNYSGVYFNHKVANNASTLLYPIAMGIVPEKGMTLEDEMINDISGEGINFRPFIKGCNSEERLITLRRLTRKNIERQLNEKYRCPEAWYKKINYNSGEYKRGGRTIKNLPSV
jgi:hypothetical protein